MNSDLKIEWWPIENVTPYEHNPRKIPRAAPDKVKASIKEFGWRQPIVATQDGVIIVGTVRYLSAREMDLDRVPVHVAEGLTPAQVQAYRLMDNRSHEEAKWDPDLLKLEIRELDKLDFDLKFTGFEAREIDEFLVSTNPANDDAANQAPAPPAKSVSRLGDLWRCGPHRLLNGGATIGEDVERALGELRPLLMSVDPPYGVGLDPMWREEAGLGVVVQSGKVENDDRVDWSAAYRLFPGDVAYVWHAGLHSGPVAASLEAVGFEIRAQIIWTKPHFRAESGRVPLAA